VRRQGEGPRPSAANASNVECHLLDRRRPGRSKVSAPQQFRPVKGNFRRAGEVTSMRAFDTLCMVRPRVAKECRFGFAHDADFIDLAPPELDRRLDAGSRMSRCLPNSQAWYMRLQRSPPARDATPASSCRGWQTCSFNVARIRGICGILIPHVQPDARGGWRV